MIVTLLPENLIKYIPLLNKVLPTRPQVPILSNVLLEATKDGFYIRSTDLEMGVEVKIPAKIEREGSVTIPGREFLDTVSSLPKDKITISYEKEIVTLTCRDNKIAFNTISASEFPNLYKEKGTEVGEFSREEFIDIFSYLTFSVSQEDSRPQLTGVYIDSGSEGVSFVSTDGYRMSVKKTTTKETKIKDGLIVSVGLINEIISLKTEDPIKMFINKEENQIIFVIGDAILIGRMIDGAFPDYEKVISDDSLTIINFEREELLQCVKLASIFAKDSSNIATLEVTGDVIKITTKSQGVGEGEGTIECKKKGEDNKISFNIRYLMDLLKTINEKSIELRLNTPTEPALFEVKEKNFLHVIMPIQVD